MDLYRHIISVSQTATRPHIDTTTVRYWVISKRIFSSNITAIRANLPVFNCEKIKLKIIVHNIAKEVVYSLVQVNALRRIAFLSPTSQVSDIRYVLITGQ